MVSTVTNRHSLRLCVCLLLAVALVSLSLFVVNQVILIRLYQVVSATKEQDKCSEPKGNSCTASTSPGTIASGLGAYYEFPCTGVGCNFERPFCRLCANHPSLIGQPYPKCPVCVPKVNDNLSGPSSTDENVCQLPRGDSCTASTSPGTIASGLGAYYEFPCTGVGCNFNRPFCRLCANHPSLIDQPYPECPACVPKMKDESAGSSRSEESACQLPRGNSCTDATPDEVRAAGLGVYYKYPCRGAGCNFIGKRCRLCAKDPTKVGRPYPKCPKCVN